MNLRVRLFLFLVMLSWLIVPEAVQATVVRMQTSLGVVDIKLYDLEVRQTVENFLKYVNDGDYDNSIIHRSDPRNANYPSGVGVIQGGGYAWNAAGTQLNRIPTDPPIDNQYSVLRPNIRGTIAMARLDNPDSATSQWFVNLVNNTTILGVANNGGFTVFGEVMANGMAVADAIAGLSRVNAGGALATLPVISIPPDRNLRPANMVMIKSAKVLPTTTVTNPTDRMFNYLEAQFFEYLAPASQPSATTDGYYFRYYPDTNSYVGVKDDVVYYVGPPSNWNLLVVGSLYEWVNTAISAGY